MTSDIQPWPRRTGSPSPALRERILDEARLLQNQERPWRWLSWELLAASFAIGIVLALASGTAPPDPIIDEPPPSTLHQQGP